jgi:UDP-3-O-[3-hydroxymyristoyl] glucosamine N-acyltransferase
VNATNLVVIGSGPMLTLALSLATAERGADHVHAIVLDSRDIATFDAMSLTDHAPGTTEAFAAVGSSALNFARFDLWAKLKLAGYRCATLVHRDARCDPSVTLADNVLVGAAAVVQAGASIGRGSIVGAGSIVGVDTKIAPWCWLANGVVLGNQVSLGAHAVLGVGVGIADVASIEGPCEIDVAGTYRGAYGPGTFISPEFPLPGARVVRPD